MADQPPGADAAAARARPQQRFERKTQLEDAMAPNRQAEHRPAEQERIAERRPGHVLDDPPQARSHQQLPRGTDQGRVDKARRVPQRRVRLTRTAPMDGVEVIVDPLRIERECVVMDELERVSLLPIDVHAHHLKARTVVAHRGATGPAEEIEQPEAGRHQLALRSSWSRRPTRSAAF
jgi:hypothetical protein